MNCSKASIEIQTTSEVVVSGQEVVIATMRTVVIEGKK
jgi:hypothetical protein